MRPPAWPWWILSGFTGVFPLPAASLNVVPVSAPEVWCVFSSDCAVSVSDTEGEFAFPSPAGRAVLRTRTFAAAPGTAAAGHHAYLYRLDLSAFGAAFQPCVAAVRVPVSQPVLAVDYNGDRDAGDQVFVVTNGVGVVGVQAEAGIGYLEFRFTSALCLGASSFFFGFASAVPPESATAEVFDVDGNNLGPVDVRAPVRILSPISLSLDPTHGPASSPITVTGRAPPELGAVRLLWDDGLSVRGLTEVPVRNGEFKAGVLAPADAPVGAVTILVYPIGNSAVTPGAAAWLVEPAAPATLQGVVVSQEPSGTRPVGEAEVRLMDPAGRPVATTRTDSSGTYRISDVSPGPYTMLVLKDGLYFEETPVEAQAGAVSSIPHLGKGSIYLPAPAFVTFVGGVVLSHSLSIYQGNYPVLISDQSSAKTTQILATLPALGSGIPALPVRFWADVQFATNVPAADRKVEFELLTESGTSLVEITKSSTQEVVPGDPIFGFSAYTSTPGLVDLNAHTFPPGNLQLRVTPFVGGKAGIGKVYTLEVVDLKGRWLSPWVKPRLDSQTGLPVKVIASSGSLMYILNADLPQPDLLHNFSIPLGLKTFQNSIGLSVPFQEVFFARPGKGLQPSYAIPAALELNVNLLSQKVYENSWPYKPLGKGGGLTYEIAGPKGAPVPIFNQTFGPFTIYQNGPGIICVPLCLLDCSVCGGYKIWVDLKFGAGLGLNSVIQPNLGLDVNLTASGSATLGGRFKAKAGVDIPGIGDIGCSANAAVTGTGKLFIPFQYHSAPSPGAGFGNPCVSIEGDAGVNLGCVGLNLGAGGKIGPYYWPEKCVGGAPVPAEGDPIASLTASPSPAVAADEAGNAMAVWVGDAPGSPPGTAPVLYYSQFSYFGADSWSPPALLTPTPALIGSPKVVFLRPDDAIAVWTQNRLSLARIAEAGKVEVANQELLFARWNGLTWSPPQPITDDELVDAAPTLASTSGGSAVLLWTRRLAPPADDPWQNRIVIVSSFFDGRSWSEPLPLDQPYPQMDTMSDVTLVHQEQPFAVWQRHTDGRLDTYEDRRLFWSRHDGRWSVPEAIPGTPPGAFGPSISADTLGHPIVVFTVPARLEDGSVGPGIGNRNQLWYAFRRDEAWEVGPIGEETFAESPTVRLSSANHVVVVFRRFGDDLDRLTGDVGTAMADLSQPRLHWALDYLTADGESNLDIAYALDREIGQHLILAVKQDPSGLRPPSAPDPAGRGNPVPLQAASGSTLTALRGQNRPDLVIHPGDVSWSNPRPARDETVELRVRVQNIGFRSAPPFKVRCYEAADRSWTFLGEAAVSTPMLLGESTQVALPYRVVNPGPKRILAIADEPNAVFEFDKRNNRAQVWLGLPPRPEPPVVLPQADTGEMILGWGGLDLPTRARWHVYRALGPNGDYEFVGATADTRFTDSLAVPGVEYLYRLVAVDADGTPSEPGDPSAGLVLPAVQSARLPNGFLISWPDPSTGFELQETADLSSQAAWRAVTQTPAVISGRKQVLLPLEATARFYRLARTE